MSRVKNTTRNFVYSILFFALQSLLTFITRTIFIYVFAKQFLGLNTLLANIVQTVNVVELGIGAAIGYSMYKPAAENNIEKLKSLNALFKKIYFVLAFIVFITGLFLMPAIPSLIKGNDTAGANYFAVYLLFLTDTILSYLMANKRTLIFIYQRHSVLAKISILKQLVIFTGNLLALLAFKNYYAFVAMLPISTLIEVVIVFFVSRKMYPEISGKAQKIPKDERNIIIKNSSSMALHKISGTILLTTDALLLSIFFGLETISIYSNYMLIISVIATVVNILVNSIQASIGNYIVSESVEANYSMFKSLNIGLSFFVGFCTICLLCLFQPFIISWIGADWTFSVFILFSLVFRFFYDKIHALSTTYGFCAGLMRKTWWKAILEPLLNICFSLLFMWFIGLPGIFIGTMVSSVVTTFWVDPFVLHKYYFKKKFLPYLLNSIMFTFITFGLGALSFYLCSLFPNNVLFIAIRLLVCTSIIGLGYLLCYFWTKDFKEFMLLPKKLFKKKEKTNNKI